MIRTLARWASTFAILSLLVGAEAMWASSTPAAASAGNPAKDQPASISMEGQSPWSALGTNFTLQLAIKGSVSQLEVRVIAHQALVTRSAFERSLNGKVLGSPISTITTNASDIPQAPNGDRVLTLGLQDPSAPRDNSKLQLRRGGVYTLEVQLANQDTEKVADSFVTHIVVLPANSSAPKLDFAWVWPLAAPPAHLPNGTVNPVIAKEFNGRLTRLVANLPNPSTLPISVAPGPETLEAWSRQNNGPAQIDQLHARVGQILSGPYVSTNFPALATNNLKTDIANTLTTGNDSLRDTLNTRIDARTLITPRLDDSSLAALRQSGVDRLILNPDSISGNKSSLTPDHLFDVASDDHKFSTATNDVDLADLLTSKASPAISAQNFLAGLAMVAFEQPSQQRGVVVVMPENWNPSQRQLNALVTGLQAHPLLQPMTLDNFFDDVPAESVRNKTVVRKLATTSSTGIPVSIADVNRAQSHVQNLESLISPQDQLVESDRKSILTSLSSDWHGKQGRKQATAILTSVNKSVDNFVAKIRAPIGRTVTITSRRAEIPITFQNDTGHTVSVKVRLESDKLSFPNGSEHNIQLDPRSTTLSFPVETRASGNFPLNVIMTSPDGSLQIQRTRLDVRSSAFTNFGLIITIISAIFLALWWLLHFLRHRGQGKNTPTPIQQDTVSA